MHPPATHPADPAPARLLEAAERLAALGQWAEAHRALDHAGAGAAVLAARARVWQRQGLLDDARALLERAWAGTRDATVGAELGWLLVREGRLDDALVVFRAAWAGRPGLASALAGVAVCLERSGRASQALNLLDPHMRSDTPPAIAWAWARAAVAAGAPARVVGSIPAVLRRTLRPQDRSDLAFVLGDALDALGDLAGAAAAYELANLGGRPFDAERHLDAVRTMIQLFPRPGVAPSPAMAGRGLLVVGVPRSGTTLVETMLARHPAIVAGGERETWRLLALQAGDRAGLQPWYREAERLGTADLAALGAAYLRDLDQVDPRAARVVDKMPNNILHVGLATWCLPDTVVVRCVRDEADTAWSCWRLSLGDGLPWARSWRGLAAWMLGERLLMDHAAATLGARLVTVRYDELVRDPVASLRPVIEACNLPWDPRVGEHAGTDRRVATASYAQVRQPLHAGAVGKSRRYHPWMGAFFAAWSELGGPPLAAQGEAGSRGNKAGMSAGL